VRNMAAAMAEDKWKEEKVKETAADVFAAMMVCHLLSLRQSLPTAFPTPDRGVIRPTLLLRRDQRIGSLSMGLIAAHRV